MESRLIPKCGEYQYSRSMVRLRSGRNSLALGGLREFEFENSRVQFLSQSSRSLRVVRTLLPSKIGRNADQPHPSVAGLDGNAHGS